MSDLILDPLNPEQREAVTHPAGPALVLAGAGSGKTRVLVHRAAWLLREGAAHPGGLMAVTFTNKAARELKERLAELLGPAFTPRWVGTFHGLSARILRMDGESQGVAPDFQIYDSDDQLALMKQVMRSLGLPIDQHPPRAILSIISRSKNALLDAEAFAAEARPGPERLAARLYPLYEQELARANALDFDDLIVRTIRLLRDSPEVRERYRSALSHVLVDEYQDTNRAQFVLVSSLLGEHRNLMAVGDDDQSIYRWRGAHLGNILDFQRDFPDAVVLRLTQNYRSTVTILRAANDAIRHNEGRMGKDLWTENGEGEPIRVARANTEEDEALWVSEEVGRMRREGRPYSDAAILVRTNAQTRAFEEVFRRENLPYEIVGSVRFYDRKEIRDVLAYVKVVANLNDVVSLTRILNVPARGVGDVTRTRLLELAVERGIPVTDVLDAVDDVPSVRAKTREAVHGLASKLREARRRSEEEGFSSAARWLYDASGYRRHLESGAEGDPESRTENVEELLASMEGVESSGEASTLTEYLERVSLTADVDQWREETGVLTLLTIHAAKGLEFPVVFVAGLEEGLLPHASSSESVEGLEEERRLFYVAVTRAKERVNLSAALTRRRFGGREYQVESRFLGEISPELLEEVEVGASAFRPAGRRESFFGARAGAGFPLPPAAGTERGSAHPDYENESQLPEPDLSRLSENARIYHPEWGEGTVVAIEGRGERTKVTIQFAPGVTRKFMLRYAPLEVLDG
jgi:DNA helicase-2/ATP-dependent DNA helicase PcrA